ncbi:MAG TPA: ABC transporter permease [Terriglobales bacterium]|nr:ABC transporter permease [Terriglobales bacterium]
MTRFLQDLRYAIRQLRKSPGFTTVAILTLALGIGANTAAFTLANAFLIRTFPYPHPERLGVLLNRFIGIPEADQNSLFKILHDGEMWELVRDNVPSVIAAAASAPNLPGAPHTIVNLQIGDDVESVSGARVSAHYFEVMGVRPLIGREFTEDEDRPRGPNAVVLSYNLWRRALHGDKDVLGKAITLKGEPYTIVGVLPPHVYATASGDLWTPLRPSRTGEGAGINYFVYLRLRDGATWQQADTELSRLRPKIFEALTKQHPQGHAWMLANPLQSTVGTITRLPILILTGAVMLVLLIACANLAGITLARVAARRHEIATRMALGASRAALLRQFWTEALLLAALGAALGVALAASLFRLANQSSLARNLPVGPVELDWRVLLFAISCMALTTVLFGVLPALQRRIPDLRAALSLGDRSIAGTHSRLLRQGLVAGEMALTVVLLVAAGLLIRTLVHLQTLPSGFSPQNITMMKASLDDSRYGTSESVHQLLAGSLAAVRQIPGVKSAGVGLDVPYERSLNEDVTFVDGPHAGKDQAVDYVFVSPGYFETLELPVLFGRSIGESDTADSQHVALVNESFARLYFGAVDAVGRHFKVGKTVVQIVGVAGNVMQTPGLSQEAPLTSEPTAYVPYDQQTSDADRVAHVWFQPTWIVRTAGNTEGVNRAVVAALKSAAPDLPFSPAFTMDDVRGSALSEQQLAVAILSGLAILGLLLSAIGVYGLIANLVVQRRREIGIRMALGANRQDAVVEIGRSGIYAMLQGLVAGIVLGLLTARILRGFIYGISTHDSLTLIVVPLILAIVASIAAFLPALRITSIEPAETLRAE